MWNYVDWDGDGDKDIVVGIDTWDDYGWDNAFDSLGHWTRGPLHGYVYLLENTGRGYVNRGKVEAGGAPIDVYGAPNPCVADFDGDGDLDLICGEFIDGMTAAAAREIFSGDELPGRLGGGHSESRPKIVLVEDNPQLQLYCRSIFAPRFDVFVADNGVDGFDLINAEMPDVVITDVLMSKMDGYELCRKVKNDVVLSHIPVVILTAKVTDQDKIVGYQAVSYTHLTLPTT